jgi:peptidoglycan/LPS O-acetylase OafA/YrhL
MGFYSFWPYLVGMAAILILASTPLLRWADAPPKSAPSRIHTLDGLRGFLALGVVFHHAAIYHQYLQTGGWYLPPSRFYTDLGQVGVALFFMITGYLFWSKILKTDGRPNLLALYVGRAFRIVPLYMLLAVFVLLAVGILTHWEFREPGLTLAKNVAKWLTGGVWTGGEVNATSSLELTGGITWTLHYEWIFYASLALLSFLARKPFLGSLLPVLGLLAGALVLERHPGSISASALLMFSAGMTAASARRWSAIGNLKLPQWVWSTLTVACLSAVMLLFDGVYAMLPILILGTAFAALTIYDATLFGILLSRPAKRLGDISYGIYLLQGPVFFLAFASPAMRSFARGSALGHWAVSISAAIVLVLVATITHVLIERPGINAGQRVWSALSRDERLLQTFSGRRNNKIAKTASRPAS